MHHIIRILGNSLVLWGTMFGLNVRGQVVVEFAKPSDDIQRSKDALLKQYEIKASGLTVGTVYEVKVTTDNSRTNYAPNGFALDQPSTKFTATATEHKVTFYLKLEPDSEPDRERLLVLQLDITAAGVNITAQNTGVNKQLDISVKATEPLETYSYLAYIGTNFDLVDGPIARNLFFATNIYLPNRNKGWFKMGAFFSLYGNRPMSLIDSAGSTRQLVRIEPTSDTTYNSYYEQSERTTVFTSDNLGAYFSPLINLGPLSKYDNDIAMYFAPSAEFIFRRTSRITTFTDGVPLDTVPNTGVRPPLELPDEYSSQSNAYEFRWGGGLMLAHEGKNVSVRMYFSVGSSSVYAPMGPTSGMASETPFERTHGDISFSGRLWITERTSGLTMQAEVVNSLERPRPFYGVTLSKAIDFKNLGGVFKPLGRD